MLDFLAHWDYILENMDQSLSDKTLRDIIFQQCSKSTALAEDLAHYRRVGLSHADHSTSTDTKQGTIIQGK